MLNVAGKARHKRCYHRLTQDEKENLDCLEVDGLFDDQFYFLDEGISDDIMTGLKTELLTEDQAELVCEEILEDDHDEVAEAVIVCDK